MNLIKKNITLLLVLPFIAITSFGQLASYVPDSSIYNFNLFTNYKYYPPVFSSREDILEREPTKEDSDLLLSNRALTSKQPTAQNHDLYAQTAAVLWKLRRNETAKKMFTIIERSAASFYTQTEFHSSGGIYEYGSFTSNYKNEACQYLCKIYIEEKNYSKALEYLIKADKKYKIQFNCGTGNNWYRESINSLYAICYTGLHLKEKVIQLYLKENFFYDDAFIKLIREKYSLAEIKRYIRLGLDNITMIIDTYPTQVFTTTQENDKDTLIATYMNGSASTVLFGKIVSLPRPDLQNGDIVTREHFINEFKRSSFYTSLLGIKKDPSFDCRNSGAFLLPLV